MRKISSPVANVLSGRTADGSGDLPWKIGFTQREEVRTAFAHVVESIVRDAHRARIRMTDAELTSLIFKLASHCCKVGWQTTQPLEGLKRLTPDIVDLLIEDTKAVSGPMSLKAMLGAHATRSAQKAARLAASPGTTAPPAVIATASNPRYTLVELVHPSHLQAESAALRHCVGTAHNAEALIAKGLKEGDPRAEHYLHYAIKIRQKQSRIFSLRHGNKPCATIEYDVPSASIVQIQGDPRDICSNRRFFRPLCQLIHALSEIIDVTAIHGLPDTGSDNTVLTRDGTFATLHPAKFDPATLSSILTGRVTLTNHMLRPLLLALCASPRLVIDVTNFNLARLPVHVKAIILTSAESFAAPLLKTARDISAASVNSFHALRLESARDIDARHATSFGTPQLQTVGHIYVCCAENFNAPHLKRAGNIDAAKANSISAPELQTAGNIHAGRARSFSAPQLETAKYIYARRATSFSAPQLKACHVTRRRGGH